MKLSIALILIIFTANILSGRIGDNSNTIRQRLVIKGNGEKYPDALAAQTIKNSPYKKILIFMEDTKNSPFEISVYWKPASKEDAKENSRLTKETKNNNKNKNSKKVASKRPQFGWEYHTITSNQIVIAEYYKKLKGNINPFEKEKLLELNGKGKKWIKSKSVPAKESSTESTKPETIQEKKSFLEELEKKIIQEIKNMKLFPSTHELEGTPIKAYLTGNAILFFNEKVEENIRPMFRKLELEKRKENLLLQKTGVSESLAGF